LIQSEEIATSIVLLYLDADNLNPAAIFELKDEAIENSKNTESIIQQMNY
jgi:hypothetical protein